MNDTLLQRLRSDGLSAIGHFKIDVPAFNYEVETAPAMEWAFSLYAWVSVAGEGAVMRIGKCEGPLRTRLAAYKRSLETAMGGRLQPNEYFKGDTQPWEVEGWIRLVGGHDGGLIFAKTLAPEATVKASRQALVSFESRLIACYDPPLCGVSKAGRHAKRLWENQHGSTTAISARPALRERPGSSAG